MICEIPLTPEQKIYAAEHHDLVYRYLNQNHLPEDDYYDVIIFGYLKAVRDYLTRTDLQTYSFVTISWKAMTQSLANYYKSLKCQKRNAEIVNIHVGLHEDNIPLDENFMATDKLMEQLEVKLLLHDLARRTSKEQMDMVRMKSSGYGIQDIARRQNVTTRRVRKLLEEVRSILTEMCYE